MLIVIHSLFNRIAIKSLYQFPFTHFQITLYLKILHTYDLSNTHLSAAFGKSPVYQTAQIHSSFLYLHVPQEGALLTTIFLRK